MRFRKLICMFVLVCTAGVIPLEIAYARGGAFVGGLLGGIIGGAIASRRSYYRTSYYYQEPVRIIRVRPPVVYYPTYVDPDVGYYPPPRRRVFIREYYGERIYRPVYYY